MSRKCEKCIHCKVCEQIDDGIQLCYSGYNGCEMFEDLQIAIIRMMSAKCEEKTQYYDVVDEARETINYKKIFENIIESR